MTSTWSSGVLFHPAVMVPERPDFVSRLQRGDCEAYQELISRYGQALYNTALRITGSASDAEDALQETFLSAYRHVAAFEERSSLRTWLTRVCINAALTRVRGNGRRRAWSLDERSESSAEEAPRELPDRGESPEQTARGRELRQLLDRYLAKLSPALRQVFVLRDLEELSGEETARALGITVAAMKTRLSRARMALRMYLEPHLFRHSAQRRAWRGSWERQ